MTGIIMSAGVLIDTLIDMMIAGEGTKIFV
jgi:hypothetical protein